MVNKGVKIKIEGINPVPFSKLNEGEFFTVAIKEDIVYQKVYDVWSNANIEARPYNAVKLNTGGHADFDDSEQVFKLKGDLKFEYE